MPTKKKKRKTETDSGSLSDLFYKDRGMGLEPFIKEGSDHLMKYILTKI